MTKKKKVAKPAYVYLVSAFRRVWRWSKERRQCLENAKEGLSYRCAACEKLFEKKQVQVDHIKPVGSVLVNGEPDFNRLYKELFCPITNLQVICKPCHKAKTKLDIKLMKQKRSLDKKKKLK
jgi:5-methylcytosine-specific restriction endonuclease McrA